LQLIACSRRFVMGRPHPNPSARGSFLAPILLGLGQRALWGF
jgi:hypothetical protein